MSVHGDRIELDRLATIIEPDGSVVVSFQSFCGSRDHWQGPRITNATEAHALRSEVLKAVDLFLGKR